MRAEVKAFGRNYAPAKRSTIDFGSRRKLSAYKRRLRQTGEKEELNIGHHYLPKSGAVVVRQAIMRDVDSIVHFVNSLSRDGTLLHRTHDDVCANINSFTIAETVDGSFLGCAALYCYGTHLAEVRSIAVHPNARGKGVGHLLMEATLKAAQEYRKSACACLPGFLIFSSLMASTRFPTACFQRNTTKTAAIALAGTHATKLR